jgi:hypothetical protein
MPPGNQFRHQAYRSERPTSPFHLLPTACPTDPSSAEFDATLTATGAAFGQARVAAVYCVHGTFAGNDALGLLTELARFAPGLSESLSRLGKQTVDAIAGESGNYTPEYVAQFQAGLSAGAGRTIPVRLFNWSSQNNHIGRADGAVRLVDELARLAVGLPEEHLRSAQPPRVVLWGHSHAGNVFALVSNLLGCDAETADDFFHAARSFFRPWLRRKIDLPVWESVRRLLGEPDHPLRRLELDVVTFGTPVRYGWDADGYANLLHFIHHRPPPQGVEYQAPVPIESGRMLSAADGDYVQQIGISGSNLAPSPLALRTLVADWRLDKFLERDVPRERLLTRLKHGTRVPDEGTTLLVDYERDEGGIHHHLLGHAVYTRRKWLPLHCREVAARFYGARFPGASA